MLSRGGFSMNKSGQAALAFILMVLGPLGILAILLGGFTGIKLLFTDFTPLFITVGVVIGLWVIFKLFRR